jgi:hypothetical protein
MQSGGNIQTIKQKRQKYVFQKENYVLPFSRGKPAG